MPYQVHINIITCKVNKQCQYGQGKWVTTCRQSWDCESRLRVAVCLACVSSSKQTCACSTLDSRDPTSLAASGLRVRFLSRLANKREVWKYAIRMACVAVVLQPIHKQPLQQGMDLIIQLVVESNKKWQWQAMTLHTAVMVVYVCLNVHTATRESQKQSENCKATVAQREHSLLMS